MGKVRRFQKLLGLGVESCPSKPRTGLESMPPDSQVLTARGLVSPEAHTSLGEHFQEISVGQVALF